MVTAWFTRGKTRARRFDRIRRALKAKGERNKKSRSQERTSEKNKGAVSPPVAYKRSEHRRVRGWAFFEMVDRSAARNQYCWIASITPRKYNKAFQPLPVPLPHVTSRARQESCPRRDNGRSRGHPVGRLEGTRWLGPGNPPSPSFRSTTSFSLFSFSPCLFFSLSVCLTIPHHDASRGRPAGHQKSRLSEFQPEPANAWLSLPRRGRPYRSFPENVRGDPPNTSWRLCVVPAFFSQPVCSVRPDNADDARHLRLSFSRQLFERLTRRSRSSELTPISWFADVSWSRARVTADD